MAIVVLSRVTREENELV